MNDAHEEHNDEIENDVVYEEDKGAELVKKLRTKLKQCEQEKKEYLDGWQRLKADNVNNKAKAQDKEVLVAARARGEILEDLLPILDSFDMAFQGDAWNSVDEVWRTGMEQLHAQLVETLRARGYEAYGESGEAFDPQLHEAIAHEQGGASDTIARVQRKGYRNGDMVVRAAQVVVYS